MPNRIVVLSSIAAIGAIASPAAAQAQASGPAAPAAGKAILPVGYQIPLEPAAQPALVGPRNAVAVAPRRDSAPVPANAPRKKFEPQWSREIGTNGPSVELAALGGGRSNAPSLVHFAFSWDF